MHRPYAVIKEAARYSRGRSLALEPLPGRSPVHVSAWALGKKGREKRAAEGASVDPLNSTIHSSGADSGALLYWQKSPSPQARAKGCNFQRARGAAERCRPGWSPS